MKILSVIDSLAHGGAETVLVDLVEGLTRHEHCVLHFSAVNGIIADLTFVETLWRAASACIDADWRCLRSAAGVQSVIGDFRPDVVLFHWWGQEPWRPWVSESLRNPAPARPTFVVVLHHAGLPPAPGYDHYVLVSESQRSQVADRPPSSVRVIPNGVDLSRFAPRPPRALRPAMVVGRLSSLRSGKIPESWVRTAAAYNLPRTRFVIAGDGPVRQALMADVRTLGLERQFDLPGYVPRPEVPHLLASFDVFCYVTSTAVECHPLALLEALATGLPVVAERRGGIPEIVDDGLTGLLARSHAEVGAHLHALRHHQALYARLAAGARRAAERFGLSRQLAAYEGLLSEIEHGRRHPASKAPARSSEYNRAESEIQR